MNPIRSGTARLIVLIPSGPPGITNGPSVTLTEGVEANLSCQAEGGKPAAQVRISIRDHNEIGDPPLKIKLGNREQ